MTETDELPPEGWTPADEDLKPMRLAASFDPDAHLRADPASIEAAEAWFANARGVSPLVAIQEALEELRQPRSASRRSSAC